MKNESGLGLVEVIVASAIMLGLSLGIMRLMDRGYKSSAELTDRQEVRDIRDEFYVSMRNNNCGLTPQDELLADKNYFIDVDSDTGLNVSHLYGPHSQVFKPEDQYGRIKIEKDKPFKIVPLSRNSPLIQALDAKYKTAGGFYNMNGNYAAELRISLLRSKASGGGKSALKYAVLLTLDATKKIIACKSMAELSTAKNSCENMAVVLGKLEFEWNPERLKCEVKDHGTGTSDGRYDMNEAGEVDPLLYVLSKIPSP